MSYTFDFIRRDGQVDHFQLRSFPDDTAAESAAEHALRESGGYQRVDVWSGDRQVARIEEHRNWRV